jgi:prolyl-tRNA editing enzyme YbaK/EbsC (Cys-tRNA(Pro) deacylase)
MATVDFSRFASVLSDLGVAGAVRVLPDSASTAAAAAAQLGCEVGAIANSLVFAADGAPLLVMTSGAHRVDTSRVASLVGAAVVSRADARSVRAWTGQVIGGVGPVGHPAPIRTVVDVWLAKYDVVWAAAGHPHTVFPTSFDELVRITGGTSAEVGDLRCLPRTRAAPRSCARRRPWPRGCTAACPARRTRARPRGS